MKEKAPDLRARILPGFKACLLQEAVWLRDVKRPCPTQGLGELTWSLSFLTCDMGMLMPAPRVLLKNGSNACRKPLCRWRVNASSPGSSLQRPARSAPPSPEDCFPNWCGHFAKS